MPSRSIAPSLADESPTRLLDQSEAVTYLRKVEGVKTTQNTLRQWRYERRGPNAVVVAGRLMYDPADLTAWVKEQVRKARESRQRVNAARL